MFVLGHLGIGSKLAGPWAAQLPRRWLLAGTLVPDLVDKPLYYALALVTGKRGAELGLVSGTRTFGHTALFLIVLTVAAFARKSRPLAAVALGVATHLLLDNLGDHFIHSARPGTDESSTILALLFPFLGWKFPVIPFKSPGQHLGSLAHPYVWGGELAGAAILAWDTWKARHRPEILGMLRRRKKKRSR
jgi:hypothetical protein